MTIYPCMYRQNGKDYLYSMCNKMNVGSVVTDMNKRLQRGEARYNGLSFSNIEFSMLANPMKKIFHCMTEKREVFPLFFSEKVCEKIRKKFRRTITCEIFHKKFRRISSNKYFS